MTTLKVGIASYEDYKKRTMAVARGQIKPGADDPKVWFTSMESFAKVFSDRNRELLALIAATKPSSMNELAEKTGRAPSYALYAPWSVSGWSGSKKVRVERGPPASIIQTSFSMCL